MARTPAQTECYALIRTSLGGQDDVARYFNSLAAAEALRARILLDTPRWSVKIVTRPVGVEIYDR